ncbi:MAG: M28 family peptidase, partial [Bacteroidota bacterium]
SSEFSLCFSHMKLPAFFFATCLMLTACGESRRESPGQSGSTSIPAMEVPTFDGQRAFQYLKQQTDFGPRNPGSDGYRQCLAFLHSELSTRADSVFLQRFSYRTSRGESYQGTNIVARFGRTPGPRILLTAHWDTRPWADQDVNPGNYAKPILGANDGASGVAVLLEFARIFSTNPPPAGFDIVLFDAEDVGESGNSESYAQGSQYFAKNLPANTQYRYAINFDMVGDKNLEIRRESNSDTYAPALMDAVFNRARLLRYPQFIDEKIPGIYDDHIPLNQANIPAIDLIDFNYPDHTNRYWHSMDDTPDKCSPESLDAVGTVILHLLYGQGIDF